MAMRWLCRSRVCSALAGVVALLACCAFLSCTPDEKHRLLTFFFDGVPPLHPPEAVLPPKAKAKTAGVSTVVRPQRPKIVWYVHKPARDNTTCVSCHDLRSSFRLVAPMETLCIGCHREKTREFPKMHGPVAIGDCGVCHEAHRSKHEHLVREPAPDLCFRCHERTPDVGKTLGCVRLSDDSVCTKCHGAHGGKAAFFLIAGRGDVEGPQGDSPSSAGEGGQ